MKTYCFVLMPFGTKVDEAARPVNFDAIYEQIFAPAIESAELEPIRADEEMYGGIIHKPMFERLMICRYAVADLTTANPNVFYELGIRHGIRPHSTILTFAKGMRLPFDVEPLRGLPYRLNEYGYPIEIDETRNALADRLVECRKPYDDSPLYQLVTEMPRPDLDRLKTDTFRDVVEYSNDIKKKLARARQIGATEVANVEGELGKLQDQDPAVLVDLFLSYRDVKDYERMVKLTESMPPELKRSLLVQEQLAFALNRVGKKSEAEDVLRTLIDEYGPSSETNGLLGRVYKDHWEEAIRRDAQAEAQGYLKKAIETYLQGFYADWRDAYPGINAVTLMELLPEPDERQKGLLPVVEFAVLRRLEQKSPDYWDYATLLELHVLHGNQAEANHYLSQALAENPKSWETESTAKNIGFILKSREARQENVEWIRIIHSTLENQ